MNVSCFRLSRRSAGGVGCFMLIAAMLATVPSASAQLAPNQTNGFGNNRVVTFTYLQSFDCVDQPTMDLDFNKIKAQSDPNEMQIPICQPVTEPTQDPAGGDIKHTAHLYVFVPMFTIDNDKNPDHAMPCPFVRTNELCGHDLGEALITAFGFLPEAWKTHPLVATQCPDPNNPVPGTCTMHASSVDLSVTLAALGKGPNPPTGNIFVPTPNHDHVVDDSRVNSGPIWWEVRPVLIMHKEDWPAADGSSGITSAKAMDDAEKAGRAIEVGSNFFLFFSSRLGSNTAHLHHGPVVREQGKPAVAEETRRDTRPPVQAQPRSAAGSTN
jgi:hypothetical protein